MKSIYTGTSEILLSIQEQRLLSAIREMREKGNTNPKNSELAGMIGKAESRVCQLKKALRQKGCLREEIILVSA